MFGVAGARSPSSPTVPSLTTSSPPSPPRAPARPRREQKFIATPGKGILAMDESNATAGKRLESIGLTNTEENRLRYRQLLLATPGLGQYIAGAILFEETLYQSTKEGVKFVDHMNKVGIIPGIKVRPAAGARGGQGTR